MGDFYQVVAPVRWQHFSYMILQLMPTLAVLPCILSEITKAYTTLLPLFILEGRVKGLERLRCTPWSMTLIPGTYNPPQSTPTL